MSEHNPWEGDDCRCYSCKEDKPYSLERYESILDEINTGINEMLDN